MSKTNGTPTFFEKPEQWRKWLEKNHKTEIEIIVGFYKKGSGRASITWPESVDEALCFGWIDGVRKSISEEAYIIRFTPRKSGSIWSSVNIRKIEELTAKGLMHPAGHEAFAKRKPEKSAIYSFEQGKVELDPAYEKKLKANKKAWAFFQSKGASYQKVCRWWVMSAKQEATRLKRLDILIADCAEARLIPTQRWAKKEK